MPGSFTGAQTCTEAYVAHELTLVSVLQRSLIENFEAQREYPATPCHRETRASDANQRNNLL
jgi:hypothetical protein